MKYIGPISRLSIILCKKFIFIYFLLIYRIYISLCQLLAYADDVNVLGGSVDTVKKNAEALVAANKEIGLEVNAHESKYMTVSRDQNAARIHSMKIDNSSIERVEEFKYLGKNVNKSEFYSGRN